MIPTHRAVWLSLVALGAAATLVGVPATSTAARSDGGTTVTKKLDGPFGLQKAIKHRGLVVAESDTGQITRVFADGSKRLILDGVPGVAGVAAGPKSVFAVIGGPNEEGSPSGGKYGPSRVLRMDYHGQHVKVIANLLNYELHHNPDGQVQFVNGAPVDSVSNPFSMTWSRHRLFVADGGANDVLRINPRTGKVTTFWVPPTVKDVPACRGAHANANPGTRGCDPVPTGVQVVNGSLYVSALDGEARGAGRIYKLNVKTAKVQRIWKGFTAPTGVAARPDGTVYFSEVLHGSPRGKPPAGFDPATIGRITRIRDGQVTHAQVTMPTGLGLRGGRLYASAWSIASFMGIPHAGQVVRVRDSAFR